MNSEFAEYVVKGFAVLGGFLFGWVIAGLIASGIDRAALGTRSPRVLHRSVRFLGGVALAILVGFLVFGRGTGWNVGGGGGDSTGEGGTQLVNIEVKPVPEAVAPPQAPLRISVLILGGTDVVQERFYRVGDAPPVSLPEIKEKLPVLANGTRPTVEIRLSDKNKLPSDHPAVVRLERWLRDEMKWAVLVRPD